MSTSSRSAERFKYGICLNDECPECKSRKVQQVPMRKELVCSECGKPLRECPPPKQTGGNKKLIGIIAAAVVLLGGGGFGLWAALSSGGGEKEAIETPALSPDTTSVQQDTVGEKAAVEEKATVEKKPAVVDPGPTIGPGSINLGYGTYVGGLKNGKPDGTGKLTFTSTYSINADYTAQPGEYVQGIFENGKPAFVTFYRNDGSVTKIKLR